MVVLYRGGTHACGPISSVPAPSTGGSPIILTQVVVHPMSPYPHFAAPLDLVTILLWRRPAAQSDVTPVPDPLACSGSVTSSECRRDLRSTLRVLPSSCDEEVSRSQPVSQLRRCAHGQLPSARKRSTLARSVVEVRQSLFAGIKVAGKDRIVGAQHQGWAHPGRSGSITLRL